MFDLKNVKHLRHLTGMTQHALAKIAGVSQSLVAKIETNRVDPTYSSVIKLEQALTQALHKEEPRAEQFMTQKIISVPETMKCKDIATLLIKNDISQVPVIAQGTAIGIVSETDLLDQNNLEKKAREIMGESPPTIPSQTALSIVTSLLKQHPLLLITKQGKYCGVITKANVIGAIAQSKSAAS